MISKHFKIQELVPPHVYNSRRYLAWELIDPRLVETIDVLKWQFPAGTITINNWLWGGDREWSGLRTYGSPYYSSTSQHSFGRAVDCIFSAYTTEEVRQFVLDNPVLFPYVKGVEIAAWLHLDLRNSDTVKIFKG